MTLPFDLSQILGVFVAESREHLEKLNQGVLILEKSPEDLGMIDDLFRAAHSLKGASATVGFMEIKEISHRIEDILDAVRNRRVRFDSSVANKVFSGLDAIKELVDGIANGQEIKKDVSALLKEMDEASSEMKKEKKGEKPEAAIVEGSSTAKEPDRPSPDPSHTAIPVEEFIRVPMSRINTLLNLGGELVINKVKSKQKVSSFGKAIKVAKELQKRLASLSDHMKSLEGTKIPTDLMGILHQCNCDAEKIKEEMRTISEEVLRETLQIDPIVIELQQHIKEIRMLPCSTLFAGFPRLVRDLAHEQGKEVEFKMEGEETELDKKVLEEIKDPLIHIFRNAIDHGIEMPQERVAQGKPRTAAICLSAFHRGANVVIEVQDGGKGLDIERIKAVALHKGMSTPEDLEKMSEKELLNFVFISGFSTSRFITDVSGRGVGMDVVRSCIEKLKGRVEISSQKGVGTTIHMELPLTIAIIYVLLVKAGEKTFGIPLTAVDEMARVSAQEIQSVENKMAFELRGHTVPLVRLDETLGIPTTPDSRKTKQAEVDTMIISSLYGRIGFIVDALLGKEEIYIKNLGSHLGKQRNVSGATVLGTGEIVVILDPVDLVVSSKMSLAGASLDQTTGTYEKLKQTLLVVEDSLTTRELIRSILEGEGYSVDTAMDGLDGMEKVAQNRYDLIVSDIEMPRMNGLELCRSLKANESYKDIPFVFVTARASEEEKRRGIEVGAQAYIAKSGFDQTNLLSTITRLIV